MLSDPQLPHSIFVTFEIMILSWAVQTPMSLLLGTFLVFIVVPLREMWGGTAGASADEEDP